MIIQKGVPLPGESKKRIKWPFSKMDVGDSFLAPWPEDATLACDKTAWHKRVCATSQGYKGRKFKTKAVPDEGGVRVWRIA